MLNNCISKNFELQLERETWQEYQDSLADLEVETLVTALNKTYNRKGYTLSDYMSNDYIYY